MGRVGTQVHEMWRKPLAGGPDFTGKGRLAKCDREVAVTTPGHLLKPCEPPLGLRAASPSGFQNSHQTRTQRNRATDLHKRLIC